MAFTRGVPVYSRKDGEARCAGGDALVPAARPFVTAARRMKHFATRRTLLGLRTGSFRPVSRLENADGIHRTMALDVASVVQDEAGALAALGRQAKAEAAVPENGHLAMAAGRRKGQSQNARA